MRITPRIDEASQHTYRDRQVEVQTQGKVECAHVSPIVASSVEDNQIKKSDDRLEILTACRMQMRIARQVGH